MFGQMSEFGEVSPSAEAIAGLLSLQRTFPSSAIARAGAFSVSHPESQQEQPFQEARPHCLVDSQTPGLDKAICQVWSCRPVILRQRIISSRPAWATK